ncbi:unnamed protein product [Cladocopium goreaui]|uniref:Dual specificity calcium/calmodulin-dependent 3',5'-cyclic nucleotide phosphodiesterase 1A (Cam-PDE 1A) (61 kDa Cam-PDE) n=1 Tax=Cladocopium goreaui TaxID=2562237 RepID=A0A9P1FSB1_9DINO|nr:unnamed protein product [Cladocopium goreaui]
MEKTHLCPTRVVFSASHPHQGLPLGFILVGLRAHCILECPPLLVALVNLLPFASGVLSRLSWGMENIIAYDLLKVVTLNFLSALLFRSSHSVKLVCFACSSVVVAALLPLQLLFDDRRHRLRWQEGLILYSIFMLMLPLVLGHADKTTLGRGITTQPVDPLDISHTGISGALRMRRQDAVPGDATLRVPVSQCFLAGSELLACKGAGPENEPTSQVALKQKLLRQLREVSDKAAKVYELSPDDRLHFAQVLSFLHTYMVKVIDWVSQNFARSISVESNLNDAREGAGSASNDVKKAAQRKYVQGKFQSSGSSRSMQVEPIPEHAGVKQPESHFFDGEEDFTYSTIVNAMMYSLAQSGGQGTPPLVSEETAEVLMSQFGNWDFNVVGLSEVLGSQTLRVMATKALTPYAERLDIALTAGLSMPLGIVMSGSEDEEETTDCALESVLQGIESRYNRSNPYHNSVHAADVVNSIAYFFTHFNKSAEFTDREIFAALLAAAAHDVGHDGKTGRYHTTTESPLALLYNDSSVLEMMHCSIFFAVLRSQGTHLLNDWETSERQGFRQQVIRMILDTDLAKHFDQVKKFREKNLESEKDSEERTPEQRQDILSFMLKLSDIGGSAKPFALHAQWATRIQSEFFLQGDLEREVGLPCSPFCDRQVQKVAESQQGFYTYIVKPLYDCLVPFLRSARLNLEVLQNITENEEFWARYDNTRFHYHDPISSTSDLVKQFLYRPNRAWAPEIPSDHWGIPESP